MKIPKLPSGALTEHPKKQSIERRGKRRWGKLNFVSIKHVLLLVERIFLLFSRCLKTAYLKNNISEEIKEPFRNEILQNCVSYVF